MATLTAPFLSFTASGKLADTLVASNWKGRYYVRKYVIPANPQTAAQIAQRALMTAAVSAWKNYFTNATGRAAWNRLSTYMSKTLSGFNAFVSNVVQMTAADPDASFVDNITAEAAQAGSAIVYNIDDGAAGDEAGNFEIWVGDTISGMTLLASVAIAGGAIAIPDMGDVGDVKYVKIRKDTYDRSGVFVLTLLA